MDINFCDFCKSILIRYKYDDRWNWTIHWEIYNEFIVFFCEINLEWGYFKPPNTDKELHSLRNINE